MRKYLFTLLVLFFVINISNGQIVALKAGPVVSKLNCHIPALHETELDKTYTGLAAIAGIDYLIHKYWCLSTDLGYINSGGRGHTLLSDPEGDITIKTDLHFITFNTLVHLQYEFGEHVEPFLGIGPRLDYLAGFHEDAEMLKEFDDQGELNKWLFGAVLAAGVHFDVHQWVVGFEYQYNWDMNELVEFEDEATQVSNSVGLKCSPFLVTLGYHIGGGHGHEGESGSEDH